MTTDEAAEDITTFTHIFFQHFSQFQGNRFHVAGGSYGGRSVPVFASYIYDRNSELLAKGLKPINLVSAALGTFTPAFLEGEWDLPCTPRERLH
jgi:carboxypeptidase C (cathepsin A)